MKIECEVSLGELVDKISILQIKGKFIQDEEKLKHVALEEEVLLAKLNALGLKDWQPLHQQLVVVNTELWKIEDDIRDKEKAGEFDQKFIELARSVYKVNDKRFHLKKQLNEKFGSKIVEVKSYSEY
jgi:hypothetical protein